MTGPGPPKSTKHRSSVDKGSGRESSINGSVEASTRSEAEGLDVVRYSVTFVLCNSRPRCSGTEIQMFRLNMHGAAVMCLHTCFGMAPATLCVVAFELKLARTSCDEISWSLCLQLRPNYFMSTWHSGSCIHAWTRPVCLCLIAHAQVVVQWQCTEISMKRKHILLLFLLVVSVLTIEGGLFLYPL